MKFYTEKDLYIGSIDKITVYRGGGIIISSCLANRLALDDGDKIGFGYDAQTNRVGITLTGGVFLLRNYKSKSNALVFTSRKISRDICGERNLVRFLYKGLKEGIYYLHESKQNHE